MHYCFAVFMILILQIEKKKVEVSKIHFIQIIRNFQQQMFLIFCVFFFGGESIDYNIYYYAKIIINNYIKALENLQNYKVNG